MNMPTEARDASRSRNNQSMSTMSRVSNVDNDIVSMNTNNELNAEVITNNNENVNEVAQCDDNHNHSSTSNVCNNSNINDCIETNVQCNNVMLTK